MILYPGDYSGVLQPGRHYVELKPDHSNAGDVVATLRDPARAAAIIDKAYQEVAWSGKWSFKALAAHFDQVVDETVIATDSAKTFDRANLNREYQRRLRIVRHQAATARGLQAVNARIRSTSSAAARRLLPEQQAKQLIEAGRRIGDGLKNSIKSILLPGGD